MVIESKMQLATPPAMSEWNLWFYLNCYCSLIFLLFF